MLELDDQRLLEEFAGKNSEAAFAALVARYVNLVYSAALRFTSNPHHAEEISQAVFIILARKAGSLGKEAALSGWLYQTARLTSANFIKGEIRRQRREQEAYVQYSLNEPASPIWEEIAPLLDEAMGGLGETDRNAVVLRFFENKTAREVAAALKLTEAAAHKRVNRALEKLLKFFKKRGVTLTTAIIAGAVSANSVHAAPAGLAATISAAALAKGAAAGGSTLALVKGALKIMLWTKAKTAVVVGVMAILAGGTTAITVNEIQEHKTYPWQAMNVGGDELDKSPPQVRILPSKYAEIGYASRSGKVLATGVMVKDILAAAYGVAPSHVAFSTTMPSGKYDFIANLANDNEVALQKAVQQKFGLVGKMAVRESDALLLKVKNRARLQSHIFKGKYDFKVPHGLQYGRDQLSGVAGGLEFFLKVPVVDQTGVSGDYHLQFLPNETSQTWKTMESRMDTVRQTLLDELDQAGLELEPTNMPIEMLVVERAK
jgi:uncharacterized protein (TIGR03435 family)